MSQRNRMAWCVVGAGLVVTASLLASCYGASFSDCTIACTTATGCPDGFECRGDMCRLRETIASCPPGRDAGADAGTPPGMALVPAGPFVMGSDSSQGQPSEQPKHIVNLSPLLHRRS